MTTPSDAIIPGIAQIARLWPAKDARHRAYLALVGGLLRAGWLVARVESLVEALAVATHDEDGPTVRAANVATTAKRLQNGEQATGWPTLAEIVGADNALTIRVALDAALTVEALAEHKHLPADFLRELGLRDAADNVGHVEIPYRDAGGRTVATRRRHSLAQRPRWAKGATAIAYGEDRLSAAADAGALVLVEGESDCWSCWFHGISALGIPGADCAKTLQQGHVAGVGKLMVVQEADAAGEVFVEGVRHRLAELRWEGELRVVRMIRWKDVSQLHCAAPDRFLKRWHRLMEAAERVDIPADAVVAAQALLPYEPFPVNALPAPLAAFVEQGAGAMQCDPSYFALPVLAAVAAMIGNARVIGLKRGWTEPCVIWAAVIGDSGTCKSPALRAALSPVYRLQREMLASYQAELDAFNSAKAAYEQVVRLAKKEGKPPDEALPDMPTPGRVVTGDTTIEKLGQLLADNPRGMLVSRDELRGWIGSFGRYKGQAGGSDLPAWLEFFRAESVIIDRKSGDRPTVFIPRAAVSVCGSIQPGTLARALTPEFFEAGLAARLLLAMPPKQVKRWTEAEIDPTTQARYEALLRALFGLKLDVGEDGEPEPFVLRLTAEAKTVWINFYLEWAEKQAEAEGELAAGLAKLEAYAARLAIVHHLVTRLSEGRDDCDPVEPASIAAGAALARWFAHEAERVYAVVREPEDGRQTRRLVDFIRTLGGEVTARRLQRANPAKFRTTTDAETALANLVKGGQGAWVTTSPGPQGGRPTRVLRLTRHLTQPKPDTTANGFSAGTDKTPPPPLAPAEKAGKNGVASGFGFVGSTPNLANTPDGADGFVSPPTDHSDDDGDEEELIL